jgi:subtilase family serine protease
VKSKSAHPRTQRLIGLLSAGILVVTGLTALARPTGAAAAPVTRPGHATPAIPVGSAASAADSLCPPTKPGWARCDALIPHLRSTNGELTPMGIVTPAWAPSDLQDAYNLPSAYAGAGQTVAVVDAYDDPKAESDLAVYRSQFNLPPCTTANGCFRKVNQQGAANTYPAPDADWAGEISLDVDMVSAICPLCHILLVEAVDQQPQNLAASALEATKLGAKFVSNSYGFPEFSSESQLDSFYRADGVVVTASTGDAGYGSHYPATSPNVVAVGGTSLLKSSSARGWAEIAWMDGGSFCSSFEAKPAWQHDAGCGTRAESDVSAVADPYTGVQVYDSYPSSAMMAAFAADGWGVFGGTSAASPIIAAVYALAGPPPNSSSPGASYPYANPGLLNDIVGGTNSTSGCSPSYICNAGAGYDGPTGMGTPNGVGAFQAPGWATVSGLIDGNAAISVVASVAVSATTTMLFTAVPGAGIWVRKCVDGVWETSASKIDSTTAISSLAASVDAAGKVHLFISVPNSGVYERTYAASVWSPLTRIDTNGSVATVASALDSAGKLHLFMNVTGSGVWERTYTSSTWSASTHINTNTAITGVSAANDSTGGLHLFTNVPGIGLSIQGLSGTTWSSASVIDTNGAINRLAATTAADGRIHLLTNLAAGGVYDRLLRGTAWDKVSTLVDANTNITAIATSPVANGSVHLITRVSGLGVYDRVYTPAG